MTTITLAKALKVKKVLAKNINDLMRKIQKYNSTIEGSENPYNTKDLLTDLAVATKKLVDLKIALNGANLAIQSKIYKMAELKSTVSQLKGVSTNNGTVTDNYSDKIITYKAQITTIELENIVSSMEIDIDSIQEEIDNYNHTTTIDIND